MTDISSTILAKSDQLNADDLIGRDLVIEITEVHLVNDKQPVLFHYKDDAGKPWKACKTMRRVIIHAWGPKTPNYIGKKIKLYRDPEVVFGAEKVGGIRIKEMSHISEPFSISLTEKKGSKKSIRVSPLAEAAQQIAEGRDLLLPSATAEAAKGSDALRAHWQSLGGTKQNILAADLPALKETASRADAGRAQNTVAQTANIDYDKPSI